MHSDEDIDEAYELRALVQEFVNRFGLTQRHQTPCGEPMSVPRAHALIHICEVDGGLRISDLAERLAIDTSNVSRLCRDMEDDGLLERRRCPDDRRAKRLHLSDEGARRAAAVNAASLARFASILHEMPDGSRARVVEALSILNKAIEDYEEPK